MASVIDWASIKALSFDIYGTLVDWESGIYAAVLASALGPHLPSRTETLNDIASTLDPHLPSRAETLNAIDDHDVAVQAEHPTMLQPDVIAEGFRRYARDLNLVAEGKVSQAEVDEAAKQYGAKIGQYPAFEDTVEAIKALGKRFKLIPLSNVDRASFRQTLEGPLKGCKFDAIYTAQDIGSYKPDLRNFEYLLGHVKEEFGVEQGELVHVAQSLFHDHRPAKKMGLQSVWVDRKGVIGEKAHGGSEEFGYRLRVESLGELVGIVEEAFAKA
jgi:2-haloalkanoic acid dehalogenase type II